MPKNLSSVDEFVSLTIDGKKVSFSIHEQLPYVYYNTEEEPLVYAKKSAPPPILSSPEAEVSSELVENVPPQQKLKEQAENNPLPTAEFRVIDDYPLEEWTSSMGETYIKWMESDSQKNNNKNDDKSKNNKKNKKSSSNKENDNLQEEELVEYQVDEVDIAWLGLINGDRKDLPPVSLDVLELYMDRLEKESFLQMQSTGGGGDPRSVGDDDAVCCICMNGDCTDTDMIIFCDSCNIAVHQECYGVPRIPEGQWVCRRCLVSPSREVKCVLCPNKGGAFKQTEDGRWAHVACALWIPEVFFTNTTYLEPIDGVAYIPPARWRLTCFICKVKGDPASEEGASACIQCHKTSCYVAFHVTCAMFAGIFMQMEAVWKGKTEIIKKIAFCNNHAPAGHVNRILDDSYLSIRSRMKECRRLLVEKRNFKKQTISVPEIQEKTLARIAALVKFPKQDEFMKQLVSYWKLKRIQRIGVPLLPSLQAVSTKPAPATPLKEATHDNGLGPKKKRQSHRKNAGQKLKSILSTNKKTTKKVPATTTTTITTRKNAKNTLKRLQKSALSTRRTLAKLKSSATTKSSNKTIKKKNKNKITRREPAATVEKNNEDNEKESETTIIMSDDEKAKNFSAYKELWKQRQNMERVRILCELTQKRERTKARLVRMAEETWSLENMPFSPFIVSIVDCLIAKDTHQFFTQPVDLSVVSDYLDLIATPIDLGTMREEAADNFYYDSLMELKSDFDLMIDNCLQYNRKETIYYKAALRLREEGEIIFQEADKLCGELGFAPEQRLNPAE